MKISASYLMCMHEMAQALISFRVLQLENGQSLFRGKRSEPVALNACIMRRVGFLEDWDSTSSSW